MEIEINGVSHVNLIESKLNNIKDGLEINSISLKKEITEDSQESINKEENRVNDPKKPYRCQVCPYATAWSGSFKRHFMSRHTDVKPYSCQECGYRTADVGNLKKHITAKHTSERAFKCKLCDYGTINLSHLKRHVLNQHVGERPHFCSICGYRAGQLSDIKKHIQSKHEGISVESAGCPHCEPRKKLGITSSERFLAEIARLYELSAQKRSDDFKSLIKKDEENKDRVKSAGERLYEYSVVKSGELLVTRIKNPSRKLFGPPSSRTAEDGPEYNLFSSLYPETVIEVSHLNNVTKRIPKIEIKVPEHVTITTISRSTSADQFPNVNIEIQDYSSLTSSAVKNPQVSLDEDLSHQSSSPLKYPEILIDEDSSHQSSSAVKYPEVSIDEIQSHQLLTASTEEPKSELQISLISSSNSFPKPPSLKV